MVGEIVLVQTGDSCDRLGDGAEVERSGAVLRQEAQCRGEVGEDEPRTDGRSRERRGPGAGPLVGDPGGAGAPSGGQFGGAGDRPIQPEPTEALRQVGPGPNGARDGHGAWAGPVYAERVDDARVAAG